MVFDRRVRGALTAAAVAWGSVVLTGCGTTITVGDPTCRAPGVAYQATVTIPVPDDQRVRPPGDNPPVSAQLALLVPASWSGFSTASESQDGGPLIYNSTAIVWALSPTVAAKAATLAFPAPAGFQWVGFESNAVTRDNSTIELAQVFTILNAPIEALNGATSLQYFASDTLEDFGQTGSIGWVFCPPGAPPIPTLSESGLIVLTVVLSLSALLVLAAGRRRGDRSRE